MKKLRLVPSSALLVALALAACGGSIGVDPITGGPSTGPNGTKDPTQTNNGPAPEPVAPIAPYTGDVGTNDVSILYPMPGAGESNDFVRPTESGVHGELLPKADFDVVVPRGMLDDTTSQAPSGYGDLAMLSVRLDHCSARKGPGTCTSEVRAVFQAVYDKKGDFPDGDPTVGSAAHDGALHVAYDVSEAELIVMMKQLLTLRTAQSNGSKLTTTRLEPHPILAQQGLGGAFAQGLRAILKEHLGGERIARITVFDHNMQFDSDGWIFGTFDRVGGTLTAGKIPTLGDQGVFVVGTSAFMSSLADSAAFEANTEVKDSVAALVNTPRPDKGTPQVASVLQPAFESALRIQNPTIHNAETTDCANCHLAEGAHLIAENVYGLESTNEFTAAGGTSYLSERGSVTNLHAFGYLHRKPSIMQRTANESTVVRDWMDKKVK